MSNIVEIVREFKRTQAELMKKMKDDGKNELAKVFKDIFDRHPGLKAFGFIGWTMGFNDGEACYHQGYVRVGRIHKHNRYRSDEVYYTTDFLDDSGEDEFKELFGFDEDEVVKKDYYITEPFRLINSDCATLESAEAELEELNDIVEMVFDTDYLIKVRLLENGGVDIEVDGYDCGY